MSILDVQLCHWSKCLIFGSFLCSFSLQFVEAVLEIKATSQVHFFCKYACDPSKVSHSLCICMDCVVFFEVVGILHSVKHMHLVF